MSRSTLAFAATVWASAAALAGGSPAEAAAADTAGACPCQHERAPQPAPAVQLWDALQQGLAEQRDAIPDWLAAADSAAARFAKGGRIWVGGPFPDFDAEACGRAGGLIPVASLTQATSEGADSLGSGDVVLLGLHMPQTEDALLVDKLGRRGVLVVGFGPRAEHAAAATGCDFWLEAGQPGLVAGAPAASLLGVAHLWTFTGEFVAACLRRGQMPTLWQSIELPGSAARNARYLPLRTHADLRPDPVPAGQLARAYLDSLQRCLGSFRENQWESLEVAGRLVSTVRHNGGTAYVCPLGGHLRPNLLSLPGGAPGMLELSRSATPADLAHLLRSGDLLYVQGYTQPPIDLLDTATAVGAFALLSVARADGEAPDVESADVVLDAQWRLGDAAVPLPGYDVRLLPVSGFMAGAIYWALVLAGGP